MALKPDNTAQKQRTGAPFKPGQSGNPKGRPKGSRNKLGEAFLADMFEDWQDHGKAAIVAMREQRPHEYVKVVASLLPKTLNMNTNPLHDLTDDQLNQQVAHIAKELGLESFDALLNMTKPEKPS
ncbi:MAG: DUF5681 domain-containing protein [Pseudomonadota bacterium]